LSSWQLAVNIGLALQGYPAFQSAMLPNPDSSDTMALASGVVADIATAAERGKWMGFTYVGSVLGPAVGPLLGRILVEFLGIFWFLVVLASAFTITFAIFFPETSEVEFLPLYVTYQDFSHPGTWLVTVPSRRKAGACH
jgi:MFS family permease